MSYLYPNDPATKPILAGRSESEIAELSEAFWLRVPRGAAEECWPWRGRETRRYRKFTFRTAHYYAHRVALTLTVGEIETGLLACHTCDNPPCCNPAHLYVGYGWDNCADRAARATGYIEVDGKRTSRKLTEEDVREIKNASRNQRFSALTEADNRRVSVATIYNILNGESWKHVRP